MNVWIASDIHGSALYCRKLLDLMEKRGADRLVLLGDLLYHGPHEASGGRGVVLEPRDTIPRRSLPC